MKRIGASLKIATALAVVACAFAASAASASALSVEPLSTKFSAKGTVFGGSGAQWQSTNKPGGSWLCNTATISGTTNATKTNSVNVAEAFSECGKGGFLSPVYTNQCPKGYSGSPWTVTFKEGGSASLKLNCALVATFAGCVVTAAEQTIEKLISWSNLFPNSLRLEFTTAPFKVTHVGVCLESDGPENLLSSRFAFEGIQVK